MTIFMKKKMIFALFPMMAMLLGSCTNPFNHGIGQVQEGTYRYDSKDETDLNPAEFDETTYFTVKKLGTTNFEEVKLENGQWAIYFEGGYHRIDWFNCPFASLPPFQQCGAIDYQIGFREMDGNHDKTYWISVRDGMFISEPYIQVNYINYDKSADEKPFNYYFHLKS